MRKLVIGLVVLGVMLALYAGYARMGGKPPAGLNASKPLPMAAAEPTAEPNNQGSRIGATEIGIVKGTRFFHRDQASRVDREFGFEVFLHKQGDRWQFTHPYMKLFLPKARCEVTADTGEVQVQAAFGQFVPNDALFRGNVVIHVIPTRPNDPRECYIYLDDVTFIAEKSMFSSTGPVRFVSRSAMLDGAGMELIYDSVESRLDLFRIISLKSLRIRSADVAMFADKEGAGQDRSGRSGPPAVASQGPDGAVSVGSPGGAGVAAPAAVPPAIYECILRRNAQISTPDRLVLALERLAIMNIPWARSTDEPSSVTDAAAPAESDPNLVRIPASATQASDVPAPEPLDTKASKQLAFDVMPLESFDVVVTCSGGLVVAPAGMSDRYNDPNAAAAVDDGVIPSLDMQSGRQQVIARQVVYDATSSDGEFVGPVQMAVPLDANSLGDFAEAQTKGDKPIRMTITARDRVRYVSAQSRVLFEGDCVVAAEKRDPNIAHEFTLSTPAFALDVVQDASAPAARKAAGKAVALKRFSTSGGDASIAVRRRAGGLLLGWTRVLASQLEYEAATKLFKARGGPSSELQLNNAQVTQRHTDPNAFGFNQPCYAFLSNFDELTFASDTSRILVTADSQPILIDYIPVIDGKYGQHILGDAGRLDLTLRRTEAGRTEIASLVASDGITYEDQTKQFVGCTLTYVSEQSRVRIVGSETQPCSFNGAPVDQIEMDVTTGAIKTQLLAPSTFQGKR